MKNIFLFLLIVFPFVVYASNPACPNYQPPASQTPTYKYYASYTGSPTQNSGNRDSQEEACGLISLNNYTYSSYSNPTSTSGACRYTNNTNGTESALATWYRVSVCPLGYTGTSSCVLNNPDIVQCPTEACTAGKSMGFGTSDTASGSACFAGCVIAFKGLSAAQKDQADGHVGQYTGEFEQSGATCTVPTDPPPNPNPYGSNCVTNGSNSLCITQQKPGCGLLNGKEFCAEDLPYNGACNFFGFGGYICGGSNTPPPAPNNEAPPIPLFPVGVPVRDANGLPPNGAPPAANGGVAGPGQMPGTVGVYPGPSGHNQDTGSGDIDLGGIAQESTLSQVKGILTNIGQTLSNLASGGFSGSAFNGATSDAPAIPSVAAETEAQNQALNTKIASIRSEFGTLISFGSGTSGGNLQCPPQSGFSFQGTQISLCSQALLDNTAMIGNVLMFGAAVLALYILLS